MLDWAGLLARKYDLMQQDADTRRLGMVSSANLDDTKARLLPVESAANVRLTGAQTGLAGAQTSLTNSEARKTDEEAAVVRPLANASIFNTRQQGRLYGAQATGEDQLNKLTGFRFRGLGDHLGQIEDTTRRMLRFGLLGGE